MDHAKKLERLDLSAFESPRTLRLRIIGKSESVHSLVNKLLETGGKIDEALEARIGDIFGRKFSAISPRDAAAAAKFGWQMYQAGEYLTGMELNFIALSLLMNRLAQLQASYATTADLPAIVQVRAAAYAVMQGVSEQMHRAIGDHSMDDPLPSAVFRAILELNGVQARIRDTDFDRAQLDKLRRELSALEKQLEIFAQDPVRYMVECGCPADIATQYAGIYAQVIPARIDESMANIEAIIADGEAFVAKAIRGEVDPSFEGRIKWLQELAKAEASRHGDQCLCPQCINAKLLAPFSAQELSEIIHGFVPERALAEEMIDAVLATDQLIQRAIMALLRSPAGEIFPAIMAITNEMYGCLPQGSAAVSLSISMDCLAEMAAEAEMGTQPAQAFLQFLTEDGKRKVYHIKGDGTALQSMMRLLQKQPMIMLEPGEGPKEYLERLFGPAVEVIEMS